MVPTRIPCCNILHCTPCSDINPQFNSHTYSTLLSHVCYVYVHKIYVRIHMYVRTYSTYIHTYIHKHTYTHTYIHKHTYTHTYIHTQTHIHTYIHTYTPTHVVYIIKHTSLRKWFTQTLVTSATVTVGIKVLIL